MPSRPTPIRGESFACWWLRLHGYRILARNWRVPGGEIDIVARRGGVVAFVEVKARRDGGHAHAALHHHQLGRVARAAAAFRHGRADAAGTPRLDVMLVCRRVRWLRGVEADDAAI